MSYQYKTEPFNHQREYFERTRDLASHALLWEQGCGKTKPIVDTSAHLYERKVIDALIIVAPPGVHRNWITDEIPTHMPDRVMVDVRMHFYQTAKAGTKWHARALAALLKHKGLAILAMSYEAFMTEKGKKYVWSFLRQRRCLYVLDESQKIKTPGAKRTKSIVASGVYAPYRRILTGTPIATGPFDVYKQIEFLEPNFWRDRGIGTFAAFKMRYGEWFTAAEAKAQLGYDPGYDKLIRYRNLEELEHYLKILGDRLTKDEALDLPPKLYSKVYFELTPQQRRAYDELREEFVTELESGAVIEAGMAIVRLLRLQQITCGYVAAGAEEPVERIGGSNPRLDASVDLLTELPHQFLVWARFREDINQLCGALGSRVMRYDGTVSEDECARAKEAFQRGDVQGLVLNQQKGGTGLTLVGAKTALYYSNSFNLLDRLQSEDRCHRIGQTSAVDYLDVIAPDTVDTSIVSNLRDKFDIASKITGDKLREWI